MAEYLLPLEQMIEQLGKLPGVGRKTAAKYAFRLLAMPEEELEKAPTKSWKYSLSPS